MRGFCQKLGIIVLLCNFCIITISLFTKPERKESLILKKQSKIGSETQFLRDQIYQENKSKMETFLLALENEYPGDVEILYRLAQYLVFNKKDYINAEKCLLIILNSSNKYPDFQIGKTNELLGICRFEQNDLVGAEKYFQASFAIDPNYVSSSYLGDLAIESKDYKEAEKYYLQAIASIPGNVSPRFSLAQVYESTNRFKEALTQYEIIKDLAKKNYDQIAANKATEKMVKLKITIQK